MGQSEPTALHFSTPSGCAEITHPFHPLKGKTFTILKTRSVAGVETLVLQGFSRGSFAVPKEWTDQADPCTADSLNHHLPIFDARRLLALAELIRQSEHESELEKDVDSREKQSII
jgi:hypothetical protein